MDSTQTLDPQSLTLEDQLLGINAKTAFYPAARSWSGRAAAESGEGGAGELHLPCHVPHLWREGVLNEHNESLPFIKVVLAA
jgi:hypothetical protein